MCIRDSSASLVLLAAVALAKPAHIIHIMADDLGYDNIGTFNGGKTLTPAMNKLIQSGVLLEDFHTFKICGPSRASTMTGRYPFNVGFYGDGDAQHISNFTALPELLKPLNYSTHAIGKWDVGYVVRETTPTYKGFDSFLGYYRACNDDLFYHTTSGCKQHTTPKGELLVDMSRNQGGELTGATGLNGSYSTRVFSEHAVSLIQQHDTSKPLYMYVAPQNVHLACGTGASKRVQGIQAPCETADLFPHVANDTFKGQSAVTTELDYLVGNLTDALEAAGMWEDTLIVFASDNGGPLDHTTNFPLRGGKHTFWDGGVRVISFVSGGLIAQSRRGSKFDGLAHSSDWYATLVEGVAGGKIPSYTGPMPPDSKNLWEAISTGSASPRAEVIHQVENGHFSEQVTAIRVGDMKLLIGKPGDERHLQWPELSESKRAFGSTGGLIRSGTQCLSGINKAESVSTLKCSPGCLFNISADPSELRDLYEHEEYSSTIKLLADKLKAAGAAAPPQSSYFEDPSAALEMICKAEINTGFLEPLGVRVRLQSQ
eukprot:TRINITY_DN3136_c0_g1_i2.p1 TRINITY_DN3136_c0_g1~~TRINITY_DN3136_c0_g1_i2.p1  ORF type:complete len:542 (+),score=101.85 TRINITY_DN3136_c0_g1_i2:174-1799(+)